MIGAVWIAITEKCNCCFIDLDVVKEVAYGARRCIIQGVLEVLERFREAISQEHLVL
jgi:hypothetical protein